MAPAELITDLAKIEALTPFEGVPVIATSIEVPGLSGGLNDAMRVDPVEMHMEDEGVLIIKGAVKKIRFDPVKDSDGVERVHIWRVVEATVVDEDVVADILAKQRQRIDEARVAAEKLQGIHRLPMGVDNDEDDGDEDDEATVMARAHNQGVHQDGLRPSCTLCLLEAEYAAEENGTTVEDELAKRAVPS